MKILLLALLFCSFSAQAQRSEVKTSDLSRWGGSAELAVEAKDIRLSLGGDILSPYDSRARTSYSLGRIDAKNSITLTDRFEIAKGVAAEIFGLDSENARQIRAEKSLTPMEIAYILEKNYSLPAEYTKQNGFSQLRNPFYQALIDLDRQGALELTELEKDFERRQNVENLPTNGKHKDLLIQLFLFAKTQEKLGSPLTLEGETLLKGARAFLAAAAIGTLHEISAEIDFEKEAAAKKKERENLVSERKRKVKEKNQVFTESVVNGEVSALDVLGEKNARSLQNISHSLAKSTLSVNPSTQSLIEGMTERALGPVTKEGKPSGRWKAGSYAAAAIFVLGTTLTFYFEGTTSGQAMLHYATSSVVSLLFGVFTKYFVDTALQERYKKLRTQTVQRFRKSILPLQKKGGALTCEGAILSH